MSVWNTVEPRSPVSHPGLRLSTQVIQDPNLNESNYSLAHAAFVPFDTLSRRAYNGSNWVAGECSGGANCKKDEESCNTSTIRRTRRIPSAKSRGCAKCKRVGKSCSAPAPRRTRRTEAPLGSPPTAFASPSKDAITSQGVSVPPSETPSRYVPPRRAMRRLGASALLQALPRAQSLALRRRKF